MTSWMRTLLILCLLSLGCLSHAATLTGAFSDELDTDYYDCIAALTPAKTLAKTSAIRLTLEWDATKGYIQLILDKSQLRIVTVKAGKTISTEKIATKVVPGSAYKLVVLRRGTSLGILENDQLIFRTTIQRIGGDQAGITADNGWTVDESRIQRLDPVIFTDDFMRSKDEPGPWKVQTGKWGLQSAWDSAPNSHTQRFNKFSSAIFAQNPFSWIGTSSDAQGAICTAGEPFWEDYTMSVSMRSSRDGAAGVIINMPDSANGIFVRWSPINDTGKNGNRLVVYKVINKKAYELASSPGGYLPGQWYRLSVVSALDGIKVFIDGKQRATVKDALYWRGGVGLYAEGEGGTTFDDVSILGHTVNSDLLAETQHSRLSSRIAEDNNGMRIWSDLKSDWQPATSFINQFWYRRDVYGDHTWIVMTVKPTQLPSGELWLTLNSDGKDAASGYRALIQLTDNPTQLTYTIFRDNTVLAKTTADPLAPNTDYSVRFWHLENKLQLEVDDELVLEATDKGPAPTGMRPAYRANGCFANVNDAMVLSHNMLNYYFTESPTDWLSQGTWMATTRWSCEPKWSFLAGWSRGDAALWHKQRFTGDQSFQAFVGVKMEYPREREIYDNRYRDFSLTICGDGVNPRTGYTGIYVAAIEGGRGIVILKNGTVVAQKPLPGSMVPNRGANHRSWFDLEISKRGGTITFQTRLNGQEISLSYDDPEPIAGGIPAVWTTDNGISVSRARIIFANPPTPRDDPQVVIDEPWYPEWGNLHQPLTLDFPESWASSGKIVNLTASTQNVPQGDEDAVKTAGKQIVFTPKQPGAHLYRVIGTDGKTTSSPFYLNLPVFDPSLGRDDSHAVILYRFTEGDGDVIHDKSAIQPAADLSIQKLENGQLSAQWLAGQGITMASTSSIRTAQTNGLEKLQAIMKNRACSIEFWVSTDSIYPQNEPVWASCMVSIASAADPYTQGRRPLCIGQHQEHLIVSPNEGSRYPDVGPNNRYQSCFRTGLCHIVVTWDGTTTRTYINGNFVGGDRHISWPVEFAADSLLYLGNTADGRYAYLGSFYLFAIHDRCLNSTEVLRHYNAGPSAR